MAVAGLRQEDLYAIDRPVQIADVVILPMDGFKFVPDHFAVLLSSPADGTAQQPDCLPAATTLDSSRAPFPRLVEGGLARNAGMVRNLSTLAHWHTAATYS